MTLIVSLNPFKEYRYKQYRKLRHVYNMIYLAILLDEKHQSCLNIEKKTRITLTVSETL